MKVLVTRYRMRDLVAWYLDEYCSRILIPWLRKNGFEVIDLHEKEDTYDNVTRVLKEEDVKVVVFAGHGRETFVTGYLFQPIVRACDNDKFLANKKVNAAACLTARVLGHSAVAKGCELYAGFLQPAYLVFEKYCPDVHNCPLVGTYDPLKDKYAYPFLDTMFYPTILMAKGLPPDKVYKKTYERYNYWISWAFRKGIEERDDGYIETAKCLRWNRDNLAVYPVYTVPNWLKIAIPVGLAIASTVTYFYVIPYLSKVIAPSPKPTVT